MIAVSEAWKKKQLDFLAPEGFVELTYLWSEDGLQESASASASDEAIISNAASVVYTDGLTEKRYATNELNLWTLDGTFDIYDDEAVQGYVSDEFGSGSVTVSLPEVHTQPIQGVTLNWGEEYPTAFTVKAYNGSTEVASKSVTDNDTLSSVVMMEIADYDSVVITVDEWCLPNRRVRLEQALLGISAKYTKKDLISFKHEQTGCVMSGELPKNSIEFELDNSSGRWNPNNPDGAEKYLSERQKITVRYGFDIDGETEWIKGGTFYLNEWRTPSNGMTATFIARDMLEYMIEPKYTGVTSGTLYDIAVSAVMQADLPEGTKVYLDESLNGFTGSLSANAEHTIAEVLQLCANAANCILYQDREGVLRIQKFSQSLTDYHVTPFVSYEFPEFEYSKPMKSVEVTYGTGNAVYTLPVSDRGEKQTISNELISDEVQAKSVAEWINLNLGTRKTISGEYRADPRMDVFDKIRVDSKYGVSDAVIITEITYTFTGAFRGQYKGRIGKFDPVPAGYCGEYEFYVGDV